MAKHKKKRQNGAVAQRRTGAPTTRLPRTQEPDDYFELGPIRVARYGRFIEYRTVGSPTELAALRQVLAESRAGFEQRVNAGIDRLLELLGRHDPIELIASLTFLTILSPSGSEREEEADEDTEEEYNAAGMEYLQGLATASVYPGNVDPVSREVVEETRSLLATLRRDLRWYYALDPRPAEEKDGIGLARAKMIDHTLFVRGDGYPGHVREILLRVHSCADSFLRAKFGFDVNDLVEFARTILRQFEDRLNDSLEEYATRLDEIEAAWSAFVEWCEDHGVSADEAMPEDIQRFAADHPPDQYFDEAAWEEQGGRGYARTLVEVVPARPAEERLAELLSMQFGENSGMLEDKHGRGWPLSRSLVRERPLIRDHGQYFAPDPRVFALSLRTALDALIRDADQAYFKHAYAEGRHRAAVGVAAEHLARVFGRESIIKHAFYSVAGGSRAGAPEVDLLVIFGGAVIGVEVKAGGLRASVRRGGPRSMRDELGQMLEEGQAQAEGLHELLQESDVALCDERGEEILTIRNAEVRLWFSMVITLEDVTAVSTQLPVLSDLGFTWDEPKSHVVSLPDLLVLTDILDAPADFLHYLHRRKSILNRWGVVSEDELDYLMFYLSEGLWMEDMDLGHRRVMHIGIFTLELDRYYAALEQGQEAEKPRTQVPDGLRQLIRGLGCHPDGDALDAILFMLDCSSEARQQIADNIRRAESQTLHDYAVHSATLTFDQRVLFVGAHSKPGNADVARMIAAKWFARGFEEAIVVLWVPLLGFGSATAWRLLAPAGQPLG